ncbi:MAG: DUF5667 domain-containing protein [Patescibacteria group bacterium]|nr:hypothetical protein [Patescibacteria group bacterium]
MKLSEEQLKQKLKELNLQPDQSWRTETQDYLNELILKDVPKDKKSRNILTYIFYIFTFQFMNSKTKVLAGSIVGVIAAFSLGTAAYASNDAVSGDLLYPLDKAMESMKRVMLLDPVKKAEYEEDILDERIGELKKLQNQQAEQARLDQAGEDIEQQKSRIQERIREIEENDPNENSQEDQERIKNRFEEQEEEHNEVKEMNQKQENKPSSETEEDSLTTTSSSDDTPGEPGGVGVQQRPQDQDRDGCTGDCGSNEGDGDKPREGWD